MDDKKLKDIIAEEWKKLGAMSWKARIQYIWDYYKPLLAGIIGVILLISIIVSIVQNMQINHLLNVYMISSGGGYSDEGELISMQYAQRIGGIGKNDEITVDLSINIDSQDFSQYSYANNMKLTAIVGAGEADLLIVDEDQFQTYINSGGFSPLAETCTDEPLERWKDHLVRGTTADGTEDYVAVRVTGSPVLENSHLYEGKECYAVFVPLGKHREMSVDFVDFLLGF